ncbi:hypothetical protein COTS27_01030 [Spirochaetota bacterium]|nr:hypothetical protein COTS27_01030 [Spirochaetota bacterium]
MKTERPLNVHGNLFGIGRETLMHIGSVKVPRNFYISLHTGRIVKRFTRLALESGIKMEEIELLVRSSEGHPGKLLKVLQSHMITVKNDEY